MFWPLQLHSEDLGVHKDSNSQHGSSLESVRVHSLMFFGTPGSMQCASWGSLLAYHFAKLCLGYKPKVRVVTILEDNSNTKQNKFNVFCPCYGRTIPHNSWWICSTIKPINFLSSCLILAIFIVWQIMGLGTRKMKYKYSNMFLWHFELF